MNILKHGVGFSVGLVCILGKIECDIQKVNNLLVCFNCDFQSMVFENMANAFLTFSVVMMFWAEC